VSAVTGSPAPAVPAASAPAPGAAADVLKQARRRRSFAVISHPDAGKTTLTEALALHGGAITEAGHVKGKSGRRAVVSDWQEMERARGISISSAALQFEHRGHVLNLVDTPGHSDFSEDTYRVLTAVDCAVMLIDAAKGMERQTRRLFEVCKARGLPVITVINKWDRPGRSALELMDEVEQRTGMVPTPLTWPVGVAGDFRGVLDRRTGGYITFSRTAGGATIAAQEHLVAAAAREREGTAWETAVEEAELLTETGAQHDQETFLAGASTPVLFTSAVLNFGIDQLLTVLLEHAPSPSPRPSADGERRPLEAPFSGQVFKVQAGMDRAHRDRVAFVRICSGQFERGMSVVNGRTGRSLATRYAQQVFGSNRSGLDEGWPGDVVGLINANAIRVGDTLYADSPPVTFPPIPSFAPELFVVARAKDVSKYKQFQRGITELDGEGVVQVLRSDLRGDQAPVLAAVGPMQFEVVSHRMSADFHADVSLEPLPYTLAQRTDAASATFLDRQRDVEVLRRPDGTLLAVFTDLWRMRGVQRDHPDITLEPLAAGHDVT
jgi:peptide chain release factor 3